ncbi:energy transducer TonB [Flavobacterium sp.]|uniref:energy transducer TonB n=1 Tax=Flavobacterium sp. TaxID=239 RepID=UPI00374FE370
MKYLLQYTIMFLVINTCSFGQSEIEYKGETINSLDTNEQQTGIWKLYDEKNNILISTEFKNGNIIADTEYFKDSKLIASCKGNDQLEIYKDNKTIKATFFRKEDGIQTLLGENGKELDYEILRYFYLSSQVNPMFYGGSEKLFQFISDNIDYKSIKNNKGKVKVKFVIDVKGRTSQIEIMESSNPELNSEALRIVSILPRWQPGHQAGAFVRCSYVIPISIN